MSLTSDREKDEKTRAMLSERAEWRMVGKLRELAQKLDSRRTK